jgi:cell pole-organizing protein PopZ
MSSSANPQHEPTMEEILASIRKIISEDQTEENPAAPPGAASAVAEPVAAAAAGEVDVLELTEELREEEPAAAPAPEPEPATLEDDIAFESVEAEPKVKAPMDDLISDSTRSAMDRAFAHLDRGGRELAAPAAAAGGGTLDALFLHAIQDAFTPTLLEWVDGHHAEILERLKPLIREWMDENLPSLIEAAVSREIARAAGSRPRGR